MRGKMYSLLVLLLAFTHLSAQFNLRIQIIATPSTHKADGVFIAGNFNNWDPAGEKYQFTLVNDTLEVVIKNLPPKNYQFKFTRGSWQKTECSSNGIDVANKQVDLSTDTTLQFKIAAWKDDFSAAEKKHTAGAGVHIIDTAFFIPQLNRTRGIAVYLPPGYETGKKHYPVMYLQDGQNLFDTFTAFAEEWGVDECLDTLIAKGKAACIVVGIYNGGSNRMNEYNPYEFTWKDSAKSKVISPQGDAYVDFLKQTLKPFIDKKYRTLPAPEHTIIAGSSMGGLIAYYAALKYPAVFGKAGIFSPSFWTAPAIKSLTDSVGSKINSKFFFYCGEKESAEMVSDMSEVAEKLGAVSDAMIYTVIDAEGSHNETAWRKWFAEFYVWMMADGFNNVIKL